MLQLHATFSVLKSHLIELELLKNKKSPLKIRDDSYIAVPPWLSHTSYPILSSLRIMQARARQASAIASTLITGTSRWSSIHTQKLAFSCSSRWRFLQPAGICRSGIFSLFL